MTSPSLNTSPFTVNCNLASLTLMSPQPDTQQAPIPRATTAACDVIPPRTVKIPSDTCIPSISSGDVSRRTKITLRPIVAFVLASSAVNTISPQAAPGEAAKPLAITSFFFFFKSSASNCGCSKSSNCLGSTISKA